MDGRGNFGRRRPVPGHFDFRVLGGDACFNRAIPAVALSPGAYWKSASQVLELRPCGANSASRFTCAAQSIPVRRLFNGYRRSASLPDWKCSDPNQDKQVCKQLAYPATLADYDSRMHARLLYQSLETRARPCLAVSQVGPDSSVGLRAVAQGGGWRHPQVSLIPRAWFFSGFFSILLNSRRAHWSMRSTIIRKRSPLLCHP
ncbi:hypothetical protein IWX50DRAFT_74059 [Phyllosticta citricarpa]